MTPGSEATESSEKNSILKDAWERYRVYSQNAKAAQKRFINLRRLILILTVVATILAVIHPQVEAKFGKECRIVQVSGFFVLLTPIVISVLLVGAVKFDRAANWVLLRGSAEALKKEIYFYRAQVGIYSDEHTKLESREVKLAHKVKLLSERLKGSQVHQASLIPYEYESQSSLNNRLSKKSFSKILNIFCKPLAGKKTKRVETNNDKDKKSKDDKFSSLNPDKYLMWRLEDQFDWYRKNARQLDSRLQNFQWSIYVLGGVGTLLAAIGLEVWVAVSNVLIVTCTSFLELRRVEVTLVAYNHAADDLYDIRTWWHALSDEDKKKPENFELLVRSTEETIQSENAGWVQEMRDALAKLYGEKAADKKTKNSKRAEENTPEIEKVEENPWA